MCICQNLLLLLPQIWDFNLGRLRGSGPLEVSEGANDAGFTIKSYEELSREVSLENTKGLGEIYGMNCSIAHDDIVAFKVSLFD